MFSLSLIFFDKTPYFFDVFIGGESTSHVFNSADTVLSEYCVYINVQECYYFINVYMLLFLNFSTFITILKNKSLEY